MRVFLMSVCVMAMMVHTPVCAQEHEARLAKETYERYYKEARAVHSLVKENGIETYRAYFSKNPYRCVDDYRKHFQVNTKTLGENGSFLDLSDDEAVQVKTGNQAVNEGSIMEAYNRLWNISEAFRSGDLNIVQDSEVWRRCLRAIVHYGELEIRRPNNTSRFHSSCFAMPTAAVNIYFCHLAQMDAVEKGMIEDKELQAACDMLKIIGLQAWTQPFRNDETDKNVVQSARFRNHVWWVGGNALGYRPLLPVAFMYRSIPMVDVLAEVSQKGISATSQHTYDESFWNEGFTADGAGWGHGMQCLIWGYPIDGTLNALNILSLLQGSPWEQKLSRQNVDVLMNYFRGSNYYYYKGFNLPCLDRSSMEYKPYPEAISYQGMLRQLLSNWQSSFDSAEFEEIKQLYAETQKNEIWMGHSEVYNGTRWFYNNDDLIKKNDRYHIIVNMASVRVDGLESAHTFADAYNYYTTDGATMFQKSGDEYRKAFGAYDVTAFPGVTAREGMDRLNPVTNWRGYTSKHNFAGAATGGSDNAVAGYIFEKMDASEKQNVNDKGSSRGRDEVLYGVKAYKSYFMMGDYMVALGAGVTNLTPDVTGNIRTTIDQTEQCDSVYLYKGRRVDWVMQKGKFAYSVLPQYKKQMQYVTEEKATDWIKMNPSNIRNQDLPEKVKIFRVWIDHGPKPIDDTYGYVVYCGNGMPDQKYPFEVLRNDTLVQAVRSLDKKVIEAVFYDAKAVLKVKGEKLSVSAPCAVLIEQVGSLVKLSVTDALMDKNLKKITIVWNGKTYSCEMPQGENCGKPAVIKI
ncbi:polysaccharide lyase family 8 super-sandwich domain-containing protein [Sphingobacterium lumbrici]|uniref:polysaccharide lyase family 8 super-sandwich domain-containing protein n=1 Tax=Sphingobacterium lumbrici TaxID=2559600 RepID=UPI001C123996|nr:polysaccharide lyase family 8 super-sandwich domain-containing protein [Sphingobacterium lumbrici]